MYIAIKEYFILSLNIIVDQSIDAFLPHNSSLSHYVGGFSHCTYMKYNVQKNAVPPPRDRN